MSKRTIDDLARSIENLTEVVREAFVKEREHNDAQFVKILTTQDQHTETLASHTEILAEHTDILQDHGDRLASIEHKVDVTIKLVDRHDVRLDQSDHVLKKLTQVR